MANEIVDLVKSTPNILGELYQDLAQPSVRAIGNALGTVFEFSTAILLPLKLKNEKLKINFKKNLDDYKEKLGKIPEEKRCEVHPQIGTPIMEKLTYTTNDEIADLFTTLLANASNIDMVNTAHPAFVDMIEKLSPDEARIIKYLKDRTELQYCTFRANAKTGTGFNVLYKKVTLIPFDVDLLFPNNVPAYIANLVSIGVLSDANNLYKTDKSTYEKIRAMYDFKKLEEQLVPNVMKSVKIIEGYYDITEFGRLFIHACIK